MSNIYKIVGDGLRIPIVTVDPVSPDNGTLWYNSTSNTYKSQANGSTTDLGSTPTFSDSTFRIQDNGDATKQIAFEASAITTGTTRTITMPDTAINLADIAANTSDIADLRTLSGTSDGAVDLGTFTGTTIPDASTIKAALQSLETSVETKAASTVVTEIDGNVDDLITLSGVAENATTLGTFTGTTIPDSSSVKAALQSLETSVETKATDSLVIKKDGSVAFTAAQSMGGFQLNNMADPTSAQDAATKAYVDAGLLGLKPKAAVRAGTVIPGVLATSFANGSVIDTVTLVTGDRILIKDQVLTADNGIYTVNVSGSPTRATDFDSVSPIDEVNMAYTFIQEGSQAGEGWVQQGTVTTIGTDPIIFVTFNDTTALVGGDMITKTGNTLSVDLATASGLESSNPGNNAGQLRVKLEASNPTLKFTGSNELGAKLNTGATTGNITTSATGLKADTDGSTLETAANVLQVKDAGITNAKVASGIDAVKLANGSVSNTEFQYLDGVTSALQTQLDAKVTGPASAVDNTLPRYDSTTGKLIQGSSVVVDDSNNISGFGVLVTSALREGTTTSLYTERTYVPSSTLAGSTTAVISSFSFAFATFDSIKIEYKIKQATSNKIRTGTLLITTDGSVTSISEQFIETSDVGITFSAALNAGNVEISYTNASANASTMRAEMRKLQV